MGIIVSVGITVDSYVVYFERLKDEVRAGRTIRQSVDRSFARAFRTVLTADAVAFLAAAILYLLHRRRRAGIRLHARAVHPPRHLHRLLLHPACRDPGRAGAGLHRRPLHRRRAGLWEPGHAAGET